METPNQFNLTKAVQNWLQNLSQKENLQLTDIEELTDHLWEEINHLKTKDLSEEEAFWLAKKRLGQLDELNREFGKVNESIAVRKYLIMMFLGVIVFWNILAFSEIMASLCSYIFIKNNFEDIRNIDYFIRWLILVGIVLGFWQFVKKGKKILFKFFDSIYFSPAIIAIVLFVSTVSLVCINFFVQILVTRTTNEAYYMINYHLGHFKSFLGIIIMLGFWLFSIEYQKARILSLKTIFIKANSWFLFILSFGIKAIPTMGLPAMFFGWQGILVFTFLNYTFFAYLYNFNERYSKITLGFLLIFHSFWATLYIYFENPANQTIIVYFLADLLGCCTGFLLGEVWKYRDKILAS